MEGATGYDLYFGVDIVSPLEKIGANLSLPTLPFPKTEIRQVYYWHVVAHTPSGEIKGPHWWFKVDTTVSVAGETRNIHPASFELVQNYPNPFNPVTTIEYSLPCPSQITLKVFNLLGKEVAILVDQKLAAGRYKAYWDASGLESGVYFFQLRTEAFMQTKKLLLLK